MGIFKEIIAEIETLYYAKTYEKQKKNLQIMDALMWIKFPTPQIGPFDPHPKYASHIEQCKKDFLSYVKNDMASDKDKTWGVGDSILGQSKNRIDSIKPKMNHALGGMWAHHMLQLVNDMAPLFKQYGYVPNNIVVGTPDGNAILTHQEINSVKEQCRILLNRIRELYPKARIIMYGLPATLVSYAILHYADYEKNLIDWGWVDSNSVLIPLIKGFVNKNHILPRADMSCDGVHLTPKGVILFGKLIEAGKTGQPRRLINNW
jgi:hypothetical protein